MLDRKTWKDFQETGLLWWANRILHTFGWAIVLTIETDGTISEVYPARVSFRGFSEKSETEGFQKVSAYMRANANELEEESYE